MVMLLLCFLFSVSVQAKDLGVQGHLFDIAEPDLLKQIEGRLTELDASGQIHDHNEILRKRTESSIKRPKPLKHITRAIESKEYLYDPSILVPYDLTDHKGKVFHRKGTTVNPLKFRKISTPLVFINADDKEQLKWFRLNFTPLGTKLILVSGSPFELMEKYGAPVYFDQGGKLTSKFKISHVPAIVSQEGMLLKVREVAL